VAEACFGVALACKFCHRTDPSKVQDYTEAKNEFCFTSGAKVARLRGLI